MPRIELVWAIVGLPDIEVAATREDEDIDT